MISEQSQTRALSSDVQRLMQLFQSQMPESFSPDARKAVLDILLVGATRSMCDFAGRSVYNRYCLEGRPVYVTENRDTQTHKYEVAFGAAGQPFNMSFYYDSLGCFLTAQASMANFRMANYRQGTPSHNVSIKPPTAGVGDWVISKMDPSNKEKSIIIGPTA